MTEINGADTAWVLVSCALVLLMTPGLALFYGGMVNSRNVLSTFMHSFIALGVMTIQWVVIGYSISFAPDIGNGLTGGLDHVFLMGVAHDEVRSGLTIPHILFMGFQMMFAIITPALITGAFAERAKFGVLGGRACEGRLEGQRLRRRGRHRRREEGKDEAFYDHCMRI